MRVVGMGWHVSPANVLNVEQIADKLNVGDTFDIGAVDASKLTQYETLVLGAPTWYKPRTARARFLPRFLSRSRVFAAQSYAHQVHLVAPIILLTQRDGVVYSKQIHKSERKPT